jgi:sialate O-acetylesterase
MRLSMTSNRRLTSLILRRLASVPFSLFGTLLAAVSLALVLSGSPALAANSHLLVPGIYSDHMIIQRDKPVRVNGKAIAGAAVHVAFGSDEVATIADAKGRWRITMPARPLGAPFTITISSTGEKVVARDVIAGDIFLCAGQSNMLTPVNKTKDCRNLPIAQSEQTRFFDVTESSPWISGNDAQLEERSAVAVAFAHRLRQLVDKNIPIGIVQCTVGGTSLQSWVTAADLPEKYVDRKNATPLAFIYDKYLMALGGFPFKAVLWYQGEADVAQFTSYPQLFAQMVQSWRKRICADMPFFVVQLPNWGQKNSIGPNLIAYFREAQQVACMVPNCFIVATLDAENGDYVPLHSMNKLACGVNLAQVVAGRIYQVAHTLTPKFASAERVGNELKVNFTYLDSGIELTDKKSKSFEIAGEDGQFKPASVRMEGQHLILTSPDVHQPTYCRYAWFNNTVPALFSKNGMPVAPFRNDRVPLAGNPVQLLKNMLVEPATSSAN